MKAGEPTRRTFLTTTSWGATSLMLSSCLSTTPKATRKPNVIFIMADDLGYGELGCYGQEKIRTPNVDWLSSEGMKFIQYYTGSAVCAPARCNLITGRHGGHAFVRDNFEIRDFRPGVFGGQLPLPADSDSMAKILKGQGYTTGCFGKWGLGSTGSSGDPLNQGFDRYYGYNCQRHAHNLYPKYMVSDRENVPLEGNTRGLTGKHYGPQVIADEMLKFVRGNKDTPFFVYYPTVLPHLALQAPQKDIDRYKGKWPETPYKGSSYLPHLTPRACYAAMISFIDEQMGRLMKLLKELRLDDNTIVFFTSDNGTTYLKEQVDFEFFNSTGELRGFKGSLYEGGIRAPMIVRWPGKIKAKAVSEHLAAHYDVLATLADITGAQVSVDTDGISFLPTLLGQKNRQKEHKYLFWDFSGYGGQLAVRMDKWKGIKRNLRNNPDGPLELYDFRKDVSEKNNVAKENPEVAAKIEKIMLEARRKPVTKEFQFGRYRK